MGYATRVVRRIIRAVITLVGCILHPIISAFLGWVHHPKQEVSPVTDEILLMSASDIAKKIRSKEITAVEVMQRFIKRVRDVNPVINAVVADRFDEALKEAADVDERLNKGDDSVQHLPFLGVPMSVKEAFELKGMPHTSGLWIRKDRVATTTAPAVQKLLSAGAIPFVMTNVSELCMWYESSNKVYGRTKNAYDSRRIVGGSSGGEGCLLSSGASVMGIGSDIGGSIRMPAFFNGVFGHKPSKGIVDNAGQHPPATGGQVDLLTTGPMCRYADDLLPMLQVMSGDAEQLQLDKQVDLKQLRIYSMENDGGGLLQSNVSPDLVQAQKQAASFLEQNEGVTVTPVNLWRMKFSLEMWSARMTTAGGTSFSEFMANECGSVNGVKELGRWLTGRSRHTLPAIMLAVAECVTPFLDGSNKKFLELLVELEKEVEELLKDGGVLLYPSHPCTAQLHTQPLTTPTNFSYTAIFNALGLPVTQCPLGLNKDGMPVGMQIVGAPFEDRNTIAIARALSNGPAGWVSPGLGASSKAS